MMRKGRRWVAVLAVLAFAAPIFGMGVDAAQAAPTTTTTTGAVHAALQGPTIDPYGPVLATSLRIQPPKGALVMVYRDGKPIGMYSQAAFLPAQDDAVYGVVAFRGQTVLFKGNVVARPGVTELLWGAGRTPTILFHPAPRPVQGTVIHHVHHDGASGAAFLPGAGLVTTSPTTPVAVPYAGDAPAMPEAPKAVSAKILPATEHQALLRRLEAQADDAGRTAVLRDLRGGQLSKAQSLAVAARFRTPAGKAAAERQLAARTVEAPQTLRAAASR